MSRLGQGSVCVRERPTGERVNILHGWQTANKSRHACAHLSLKMIHLSPFIAAFPKDVRVIDVKGDLFCFTAAKT